MRRLHQISSRNHHCPPPTSAHWGGSVISFSSNPGNHAGSATRFCLGSVLAPARSAGIVSVHQASFSPKARDWCSLEAGGELLAAKQKIYGAGRWILPALVEKLLAAKRSTPPPAPIFTRSDHSLRHFKPLFCFPKGAPRNWEPMAPKAKSVTCFLVPPRNDALCRRTCDRRRGRRGVHRPVCLHGRRRRAARESPLISLSPRARSGIGTGGEDKGGPGVSRRELGYAGRGG